MNETVTNLVDAIKSGDALATEQAFAAAMAEKLSSKIEDLRVNIAQNMFGEQAEEIEEEQLDELSIQTMKSAKDKLAGKAIAAHYDDNKVAARNLANRALKIGRKVDRKEWQQTNQKRLDQTAKYQNEEYEEIEEEQLDELSKDTLNSYAKKANASQKAAGDKMDAHHRLYGDGNDKEFDKAQQIHDKRAMGLGKLPKRGVNPFQ